jgi:hypothetical protein
MHMLFYLGSNGASICSFVNLGTMASRSATCHPADAITTAASFVFRNHALESGMRTERIAPHLIMPGFYFLRDPIIASSV